MNSVIRHINPRDMMLQKLKEAYQKEDKNILVERVLNLYSNFTDYQICELYSEKFETNPKYIAEQFEFNF